MKKLLLVLVALGLIGQISSCTANKAQEDTEFVENADVEKIEAEQVSGLEDTSGLNADVSSDNLSTDSSLEEALGETPAAKTEEVAAAPVEDIKAATEEIAAAPTLDESSLNDVPAPQPELALDSTVEAPADLTAAATLQTETPPPIETPTEPTPEISAAASSPLEEVSNNLDMTPITEPIPAQIESTATTPVVAETKAPVVSKSLKIAEMTPYQFGDGYVNTVYIVRPGESWSKISNTIYGTNTKVKELKKINSSVKLPRGGDKIAYVSPNRPTDSSRMITYYEDTGMVAETYVAQKGDNLKRIAKKLLGYDNAWKEIWATNSVESKSKLAEGDTLKYWRSTATITPAEPIAKNNTAQVISSPSELPQTPTAVAQNTPPQQPQMANEMPAEQMQQELPPPPSEEQLAMNNTQPTEDPAAAPVDANMPPPPPDMAAAPPPPPAPTASEEAPGLEEQAADEGGSTDMFTILGITALACAAIAYLVVQQKRRKAAAEVSMHETGVG